MVKIDTDREGMGMIFKDWQVILMNKMLSEDIEYNSRQAWNYINEQLDPEKISRASVINFLEYCLNEGYFNKNEESGKGGYHGVYYRVMTEQEFWKTIAKKINDVLAPFI